MLTSPSSSPPRTPGYEDCKKQSRVYLQDHGIEKDCNGKVICPVCCQSIEYGNVEDHIEDCLNLRNMLKTTGVSCVTPQRKSKPIGRFSPFNSYQQDFTSYYGDAYLLSSTSPDQQRKDEQIARQIHLTDLKELKKQQQEEECIKCDRCEKSLQIDSAIFLDHCVHSFCAECLRNCISQFMDEKEESDNTSCDLSCIPCPAACCFEFIPQTVISQVLTEKEKERLSDLGLKKAFNSNTFVKCPNPNCGTVIERVLRTREEIIQEIIRQKRPPSETEVHKEQYRFRCRICSTEFCSNCHSIPYHEQFTCASYHAFLHSKKCRFCDKMIDKSSKDVCTSEECQEKLKYACSHVHKCGHLCCGIKDEFLHLRCLQCSDELELQEGDDFCNICYTSSLKQAPCIELKCGHIFHYECIRKRLEKKWSGARITFNFEKCPLCNQVVEHYSLKDLILPIRALKSMVERKALMRMDHEGLLKCEEVTNEHGKYYKKPLEYAMNTFAYYLCYECKNPYYGGKIQCGGENDDENEDFNEQDLKCGSCCMKSVRSNLVCDLHGTEFIEYKCKFCCNIATWFCWGTTHFCDKCHRKQVEVQQLTKTPKSQLAKCLGPQKCPSGGNHPENGEEHVLGCSICRISRIHMD
ncbi:hypothetical protein FDP41_003510 [Naegleria fowleri]|uniref:RCR-type E3 ubiquitin transferase n=1 Tax=Naegleria fowleri TaxID=5763 RepID=A0A6A5BUB1_NAEFO|nr:uncharacterized protein FDP41_003510 [Naegleria fowleri]KAF0977518.1 hypothetical protein FDP41_003510 [Naegleria fowleri]